MINAKEARKLAGPLVDDAIKNLEPHIERLAKRGKYSLRTGWDNNNEDSWLWEAGGYNNTEKWLSAKKELEKLGYKVKFHYEVKSIAVDMYTLISW